MFSQEKVAKLGHYIPRLRHASVTLRDLQYEPDHSSFQHGVHMGYDEDGSFTGVPIAWGDSLPPSEVQKDTRKLPTTIAPSMSDVDFMQKHARPTKAASQPANVGGSVIRKPPPPPSSAATTPQVNLKSTPSELKAAAGEKIKASWEAVSAGLLGGIGSQIVGAAFVKEDEEDIKPKKVEEGIDWGDDEPVSTPESQRKSTKDRMKRAEGGVQLDLAGMGLPDIPADATQTHNLHMSIINLNLNYNEMRQFPKSLPAFRLLQRLSIDGNQMTTFSPAIKNLVSLRELTLNGNQLKRLPDEIGCLTALERFEAKNNLLEALPETFGFLVKLEELHLSGNTPLTALPRAIGWCKRIEVIDISQCGLTSLPDTFGCLNKLMEADLSTNQLRKLPDSMGLLNRLCVLNLSDNKLEELPVSIGLIYGLQSLFIEGNPDLDPTVYEKAHMGMAHLLDHLEKVMNSHVDIMDEYLEQIRPVLPQVPKVSQKSLLDDDGTPTALGSPLLAEHSSVSASPATNNGSKIKIAPKNANNIPPAAGGEESTDLLSFSEPENKVTAEVQEKVDKLRQLAEGMRVGINNIVRELKLAMTRVSKVEEVIPIAQRITKLKNELNDIKPKVEKYSKVWKQAPATKPGEDKLIVLKRTVAIALDNLTTGVEALVLAINRTDDLRVLFVFLKHLKTISTLLQE